MNLAGLSARYLCARPLNTALSLLLLALGVGTIVLLLLVVSQLEERMGHDARGIDLVVGAKGSPMQLILSGIYHVDVPAGNISLADAEALQKSRLVRKAMPLALGDSWRGFRIVGATHAYPEHYGAKPASGRLWQQPMEAVLGAEVASRSGVGVGGRFVGAHGVSGEGEEHGNTPYAVVGVLERTGTVLDRLALTSIESVWHLHEAQHEPADEPDKKALETDREITVLLMQYASPLAAATLPRQINAKTALQAASPAFETARLFHMVGVGVEALRAFAAVLIVAAGLSVFIALYTALEDRRYDLAVMRTLGASPRRLFGLLLVEALVLCLLGAALGMVLGHAFAAGLGTWLESQQHYPVSGLQFRIEELWLVGVVLAVGAIAALLPAWRAYRTDVAAALSNA